MAGVDLLVHAILNAADAQLGREERLQWALRAWDSFRTTETQGPTGPTGVLSSLAERLHVDPALIERTKAPAQQTLDEEED
jgi:hypothetical protein